MQKRFKRSLFAPLILLLISCLAIVLFQSVSRKHLLGCQRNPLSKENTSSQSNQLFQLSKQLYQKQPNQLQDLIQRKQKSSLNNDNCRDVFLFIGVLSAGVFNERREAVRKSWLYDANKRMDTCARFAVSWVEFNQQIDAKEQQQNPDFLVMDGNMSSYDQILSKVLWVFEYGVVHANANFILKTDDDAYVNAPALIQRLQAICQSGPCDKVYMGNEAWNNSVNLQSDHKWYDGWYYNQTGINFYPRYMWGGGYVISKNLVEEIVIQNERNGLFTTPIEDAVVGMWLAPKNVDYYKEKGFVTSGFECCLSGKSCTRTVGGPPDNFGQWKKLSLSLKRGIAQRICQLNYTDQWIILHKVSIPCKLEMLGDLFKSCSVVHSLPKTCLKEHEVISGCQFDLASIALVEPKVADFYVDVLNNRQYSKFRRKYMDAVASWVPPFRINLLFQLYQNQTGVNMTQYMYQDD